MIAADQAKPSSCDMENTVPANEDTAADAAVGEEAAGGGAAPAAAR